MRDAYLQRRRNLVFDGAPPDEDDIEIKLKPGPSGSSAPGSSSPSADGGNDVKSIIVSGDRLPTPAELEARERADSIPAARKSAAPDPAGSSRVVRIWLPSSSRN